MTDERERPAVSGDSGDGELDGASGNASDGELDGASGNTSDGDGTVRARYDWASTEPSAAVVETVADAVGRDSTALEPLYESVDPDALDALVRSNGSATRGNGATVSFSFAGHRVTVHGTGDVVVRAEFVPGTGD